MPNKNPAIPATKPARQCVMFYLPVVTPWWFENIVVHLIRVTTREHEVHVLIPPLWRNTGLSKNQLSLLEDLDHVNWHLLDGPDHPKLRTDASDEEDLIELVDAIAPDIVLCRSADTVTPARFPGTVRYIMEGAAPPFVTGPQWVILSEALFDYGVMPDISETCAARLDALAAPMMASVTRHSDPDRWRERYGFTSDQIVIGLPLEYEHEENFFGQHHHFADNAEMITEVAAGLPNNAVLAVTNHPLNELYGDNSAIDAAIKAFEGKAVMLSSSAVAGRTTETLARHADGMIVGNSKSWAICAAYGTPFVRLSDFKTGDWANGYSALGAFLEYLSEGSARCADPALARRWFAWHLLDAAFDPADPHLTADDILSRVTNPLDPARWTRAQARLHAQPQGAAA